VNNVQLLSIPDLQVELCMGKYAFVGMGGIGSVEINSGGLPVQQPPLQTTSTADDNLLTCGNGWRVTGEFPACSADAQQTVGTLFRSQRAQCGSTRTAWSS
jgi:hypothetical protein